MLASTSPARPVLAPIATKSESSQYSIVPVLAMPFAFLIVLLLTRLAAG